MTTTFSHNEHLSHPPLSSKMESKNSSSTRSSTKEDTQSKHNIAFVGKAKAPRETSGSPQVKSKIARPLMFGSHANTLQELIPYTGVGSYCTAYDTFRCRCKAFPFRGFDANLKILFPPPSSSRFEGREGCKYLQRILSRDLPSWRSRSLRLSHVNRPNDI